MKKLLFLIILLIFSLSVFSQKADVKPTPKVYSEKEQRVQGQKFKAIAMVSKTAEEATFWEDKNAAVEALADAADLLWDENDNQSAKWLTKAWNLIDEIAEPQNDKTNQFFNFSDKSNLRTDVLKIAYRHDQQLAEKFIKQLTDKQTDEKKDKGAFDDKSARSEQLLRLALQALETNPNLAFSLAQRTLADGISFSLQNVMTELWKKDANLANNLFDSALARLNSPDEAQILAGYLFKPGFTFATNASGGTILTLNPDQQNLPVVAKSEPSRARNFLSAVYQRFFSGQVLLDTPESRRKIESVLGLANAVFTQYNTYAPELAPPTKAFIAQLQNVLNPNKQNKTSENKAFSADLAKVSTKDEKYEARITELEEKADAETDPTAKQNAYLRALISTNPEDYKRGISIAKKIDDDDVQEDAVSYLLYRAALYFVGEKQFEIAEEIVSQIKDNLRRSVAKVVIAQALLKPKTDKKIEKIQIDLEKQRAFALLNDAQRDLTREDASLKVVESLFGTTAVLAEFDKSQAVNLFEQTVQMINKLENFNLKGNFKTGFIKYNPDASYVSRENISIPRGGFNFKSAVEPLIETDFDQLASIIELLTKRETRGVGRLEVARIFFQKNKDVLKPELSDKIKIQAEKQSLALTTKSFGSSLFRNLFR